VPLHEKNGKGESLSRFVVVVCSFDLVEIVDASFARGSGSVSAAMDAAALI
jgi:hypothetical protein